jgi:hypothetical protein
MKLLYIEAWSLSKPSQEHFYFILYYGDGNVEDVCTIEVICKQTNFTRVVRYIELLDRLGSPLIWVNSVNFFFFYDK